MRRHSLYLLFFSLTGFNWFSSPAIGETRILESTDLNPVFVELYTSQGCSSCPPAEAWINRFTQDPRLWKTLIPINLHVDYWDYLGWNDPFARQDFSKRQRLYQRYKYTHNVTTPGFVVNGKGWDGWFRGQALPNGGTLRDGKLRAELKRPFVKVDYRGRSENTSSLYIHVAILGFGIQYKVAKGENAGKTLKHDFVVVGYHKKKMHKPDHHWLAEVYLPHTVNVEMSRQALVLWISEKDDPYPLQILADWL